MAIVEADRVGRVDCEPIVSEAMGGPRAGSAEDRRAAVKTESNAAISGAREEIRQDGGVNRQVIIIVYCHP